MVLAALCEQLLPSHRGLIRNHESLAAGNNDHLWEQHHYHHSTNSINSNNNNRATNHNPTDRQNSIMDLSQPENDMTEPQQHQPSPDGLLRMKNMPSAAAATRRKRNRFRASKFLASVASDFDVITDWLFYAKCVSENREYYNGDGNQQSYKIPPWMVALVLVSCIIGTTLWVILATDGAIASPVLRFLGYDKLSLGHMLLACVLLEDIPQVLLTFYIEDYFDADQEFTNYAIMNVVVSLYDTLIKLAEAFDQRADVVETGHWCKERILAHDTKVTCLVPFPDDGDDDDDDESDGYGGGDSLYHDSGRIGATHMPPAADSFRNKLHVSNKVHGGNEQQRHRRRISRRTILQEAKQIVADTKLPPMRFLSSSNDGTVKLWDTAGNGINPDDNGTGRKPSRTFTGHSSRVSCIAFVRKVRRKTKNSNDDNHSVPPSRTTTLSLEVIPHEEENANHRETTDPTTEEKCPSYYFLTGSYDGTSTLWNTSDTACLRTYKTLPFGNESASKIEVTSIAYIRIKGEANFRVSLPKSYSSTATAGSTEYFVNGYKSGKARLWNMWSGACLRVFEEHPEFSPSILSRVYYRKKSKIYSLCSMEDSRHFAAGSVDGSIKMWDIGIDVACAIETKNNTGTNFDNEAISASASPTASPMPSVSSSIARIFIGHTKTVNAVKCVSPGSVLLSGSEDKRAMLWSVSTGACLRIFSGHTGSIHDVAIVDQVTFLTASRDTTIMAWDAFSEDAFRTYKNPKSLPITAVSTGDQNGCFVSGAEDGSIGLWIFSAVDGQHDQNNILGIDDGGLTCGWEDDVESVAEEITTAQEYTRFS